MRETAQNWAYEGREQGQESVKEMEKVSMGVGG